MYYYVNPSNVFFFPSSSLMSGIPLHSLLLEPKLNTHVFCVCMDVQLNAVLKYSLTNRLTVFVPLKSFTTTVSCWSPELWLRWATFHQCTIQVCGMGWLHARIYAWKAIIVKFSFELNHAVSLLNKSAFTVKHSTPCIHSVCTFQPDSNKCKKFQNSCTLCKKCSQSLAWFSKIFAIPPHKLSGFNMISQINVLFPDTSSGALIHRNTHK